MNKQVGWALVLIAALIIVLIFNKGRMDIDLIFTKISMLKSLGLFLFTSVGVAIGLLLR